MKNRTLIRTMVLVISIGALAVARPSLAQNALGGPAKTKQNAIGGASKPAPVIGGTAKSTSAVTKPPPVVSVPKPAGGTVTGSSIGSGTAGLSAGTAKQNPPVIAPNKGTAVATTPSNLKCGGGACVARGTKP